MSGGTDSSVQTTGDGPETLEAAPAATDRPVAAARPVTGTRRTTWDPSVGADPDAGSKDRFAPIPEILATAEDLQQLRSFEESGLRAPEAGDRPAPASLAIAASVGLDGRPFDRLTLAVERWASTQDQIRSLVVHGLTGSTDGRLLALPVSNPLGLTAVVGDAEVSVIPGDPTLLMACRDRGRRPIIFPRRPELAESDDDREVRLAEQVADRGWADLAMSSSALVDALDQRLGRPERRKATPARPADDIAELVGYWARVTVSERRRGRRAL